MEGQQKHNYSPEGKQHYYRSYSPYDAEIEDFSSHSNNIYRKIREIRLAEALEKQTHLLENLAKAHEENKESRKKAELKKLREKIQHLELEKMFKDLKEHQIKVANDIINSNNQLIFNHLSKNSLNSSLSKKTHMLSLGQHRLYLKHLIQLIRYH